jgi:DNA replication protein DnaC
MWRATFVDEVGYLAHDAHAADLLLQVISRRYEQKSIEVTTKAIMRCSV